MTRPVTGRPGHRAEEGQAALDGPGPGRRAWFSAGRGR